MPKRQSEQSLVKALSIDIGQTLRAMASPCSDTKMNGLTDELFARTADLVNAPARSDDDVRIKLGVLCRRLREFLNPEQRGEVLTALLAESIRDDLALERETSR